ncbi:MAG: iron-sulfur cluster carrier protein ApbC [Armatimonadota bacterium]|nr:iron-sulfur cluster carrier protein ApbC [Armatimonadota bacterium]
MSKAQGLEEQVLDALRQVRDPELGRDLVSLGMIQNLRASDGTVSFTVVLTTPACPMRAEIRNAAEAAVRRVPGVKEVKVEMSSKVAGRAAPPQQAALPGVKNVVAVASGKGGVGKSTVAVNLAVALAAEGAAVGLLDADIYGPSIPTMMGAAARPAVKNDRLQPVERFGVKLMSLGFLIEENTPVIWRGPMVAGAVRQLLQEVDWGELDYLVVDLPPGTGDAQLTLAQSVPLTGVVVVMTAQDVALNIATKALRMFQKMDVPVLGVVENMSSFVCPHCGTETAIFGRSGAGEEAARRLKVPFLGRVPLEPAIVEEGDRGTPALAAHPESRQAEAFRRVARAMAGQVSVRNLTKE